MHVVLNVDSLIKPSGGIGRYTWHLLDGLVKRGLIDERSCFANFRWLDSASLINRKMPQGEIIDKELRKMVRSLPYAYRLYSGYKYLSFRLSTRKLSNSIYHEPNFILKPFPGPTITSIHDLSFLHFPQYHPIERVRYLERNLENTLNQASHIITDSEYIKKELTDHLSVNENRISVTHLGVDHKFQPRTGDALNKLLLSYNLKQGHYLLSVSTIEPRKNFGGLLDAYMQLEKSVRRQFPLVLVGADGWKNYEMKKRIADLERKSEIIHLGNVSENDLPFLFSGACGFVYIPFYEGFGLPPLEAMASGVPVLTSNVASIPEVLGTSALFVNPKDTDAVTQGMVRLLTDNDWRRQVISSGLKRAEKFTWDRCVDQTVGIYENVLN